MSEEMYKSMYLKRMTACEEALGLLIRAQQECEELYLAQEDSLSQEIKKGDGTSRLPFLDIWYTFGMIFVNLGRNSGGYTENIPFHNHILFIPGGDSSIVNCGSFSPVKMSR